MARRSYYLLFEFDSLEISSHINIRERTAFAPVLFCIGDLWGRKLEETLSKDGMMVYKYNKSVSVY